MMMRRVLEGKHRAKDLRAHPESLFAGLSDL